MRRITMTCCRSTASRVWLDWGNKLTMLERRGPSGTSSTLVSPCNLLPNNCRKFLNTWTLLSFPDHSNRFTHWLINLRDFSLPTYQWWVRYLTYLARQRMVWTPYRVTSSKLLTALPLSVISFLSKFSLEYGLILRGSRLSHLIVVFVDTDK